MKEYKNVFDRATRIQYKISENDKKPKSFGTSELMYQSEIHFIDAIGINDGVSAAEMTSKLNITNGAVTQISDKLIKKGMIDKFKKVDNKKAVFYKLTEKGSVAYYGHLKFHQLLNEKVCEYMDQMTEEQVEGLLGLLDILEEYLPSKLK